MSESTVIVKNPDGSIEVRQVYEADTVLGAIELREKLQGQWYSASGATEHEVSFELHVPLEQFQESRITRLKFIWRMARTIWCAKAGRGIA